jgi:hypothetical protein
MIQDFLQVLPRLGPLAIMLAIAGSLAGATLWLMGERFNRSVMTLALVGLGAAVGLQAPHWMGWSIDGWATALAGAVLLGVCGFLMHRFWVVIGLGLVMGAWAALIISSRWYGSKWTMPAWYSGMWPTDYLKAIWSVLPDDLGRVLPFACGVAMLCGICTGVLWPRFGRVLFYSMTGMTLFIGLGLVALQLAQPRWVYLLPVRDDVQSLILLAMMGVGALLQWRLVSGHFSKSKAPPKQEKTPASRLRPSME